MFTVGFMSLCLAVLFSDRTNEGWSGLKYQHANGYLRAFLQSFMDNYGSGNEVLCP